MIRRGIRPERGAVLAPIRVRIRRIDADGSRGTHNQFVQVRILEEDVEALRVLLATIGESEYFMNIRP